MSNENEQAIREAYRFAEVQDIRGWAACFTKEGTVIDHSTAITYQGPNEVGNLVELYAKAFPDMHRELYDFYSVGDTVVVELSLNGTNKGSLDLPSGAIPATGKRMKAPCCDVFRLKEGKIFSFHCYPVVTAPSWVEAG